jgi:hypothetical protein
LLRRAAGGFKGGGMATQQRLHILVDNETAPQHPAMTSHEGE